MDCNRVQNLLTDYSVDRLDSRRHRGVKSHLGTCAACRQELEALNRVMSLVEAYGVREPPPALFNAVRNRIISGEMVRERWPWWGWLYTRPARVGAMALAMGAVVLGLMLPAGPPQFPDVPIHPRARNGSSVTTTALASSIRQHAMSAAEGPLTDRVAWEAMAQLVTQEEEKEHGSGVE